MGAAFVGVVGEERGGEGMGAARAGEGGDGVGCCVEEALPGWEGLVFLSELVR